MTHILLYGPRMIHGHDDNAAFTAMEGTLENAKKSDEAHNATVGRRNSLTDKAKDMFHEVSEMTMDLAHEVKEKIAGHVTDKDIVNAALKVADLRAKLANQQHQLNKIQLAAESAELYLDLHEYEALKAKERKVKYQERELEREIAEAEGDYIRLQTAQQMQKQSQNKKL